MLKTISRNTFQEVAKFVSTEHTYATDCNQNEKKTTASAMNHRQLKIREFRVRLSLQKIAVSTSMQKHLLDSSIYS